MTQSMHTTYELNTAHVLHLQRLQTSAALHRAGRDFLSSSCVHIKYCMSLDQYAHAHPCAAKIDRGSELGLHSREAGQPNGIETTYSRSNGFKAVRTALKRARQL